MPVYKAGDVLHECEPFALLLLEMNKGKNCDYCFKTLVDPKRCETCLTMYYCSQECANGDWELGHKFKECQVLRDNDLMAMMESLPAEVPSSHHPVNFITTVKFVLRLILKQKLDPKYHDKYEMGDGTLIGLQDMPDYRCVEHMESQIKLARLLNIVSVVVLKAGVHVTDDEIWNVYLKYTENSVGVSPYIFGNGAYPIGRAIYIFKNFEHSCCSNSDRLFDGTKLYVRAIRDFNTATEPPTLSHVNVTADREVRQRELFRTSDLQCECDRCEQNLEYPSDWVLWDIYDLPKSQVMRKLLKYVSDTKKVHKGGRSPMVLMNTQFAIMTLKERGFYAEAQVFERDMEKTARVLYGDNGRLRVQEELKQHSFVSWEMKFHGFQGASSCAICQ